MIDLVLGLNNDDCITFAPSVTGLKYRTAVEAIHDNSLNISGIYFDETVKDYSDSLNAVVYRQSPEYGETPLLMGIEISLYLTTDISKVPVPEEEEEGEEETDENPDF